MPLAPQIAQAINQHLPAEAHAANVYQRLAADVRALGFEGISKFLVAAGQEENTHLQAFIDFLSAFDVKADIPARDAEPVTDMPFGTGGRLEYLAAVFAEVLVLEETVTTQIEAMCNTARDLGCWIGFDFLMTFVKEQSEAEQQLRLILRVMPLYVGNLSDLDAFIGGL